MHEEFFTIRGGTFSSMANVPAHGELFSGGVTDEKSQIMFICPPAMEGFLHIV